MFLYHIFVRPIEYLIEVIFRLLYDLLGNPGYALFFVSIAVSLLVLPLYLKADAIQELERSKQKSMERWIGHIRRVYQGDERYLMVNAYYREQGYRPLYALRGTISLLLQVPFFIAAYHYLSHLTLLEGVRFGPIADLASEDGLLNIGGVSWNLLPILMTAINAVSTAIYTRGFDWKQKLQPYVLALVFLVLLYRSPSGLVIYWTMNNLFSLAKNAVMKYAKHPRYVVGGFLAVLAVLYAVRIGVTDLWGAAFRRGDIEDLVAHSIVIGGLCLPLLLSLLPLPRRELPAGEGRLSGIVLLELTLTLFLGCFIPMSVISSSPADFVNIHHYFSPMHYMYTTLLVAGGLFLFWGSVIAYLADARGRRVYGTVLFLLLCIVLLDFMCFHVDVGTISMELTFDAKPKYDRLPRMVNAVAILAIFGVGIPLYLRRRRIVERIVTVVALALFSVSLVYIVRTETTLRQLRRIEADSEADTQIHLSQTGKNVVVIMLDRAMACYVPYIFAEKPELYARYDGFTFYPNVVSFGLATNYGSPALYGGYDYSTRAIDARDDVLLKDKQNEALTVLPRLFGEAGYQVTVWDPPYANYREPSDLSIYDAYPYVNALLMSGRYEAPYGTERYVELVERRFFFYSILKASPTLMQDELYDGGRYLSTMGGSGRAFLEAYEVLAHLPELTTTEGAAENTLFQMCNLMTHETQLLQLPDYMPREAVDNTGYEELLGDRELDGRTLRMDTESSGDVGLMHYQSNMSAFLLLADWLDRLRELGVYDNTRIILVADHGRELGQIEELYREVGVDAQGVNCLLMMKDFDATGFTTDGSFMTNADAPVMALEGLIEAPVNPYTGHPMDGREKAEGADIIWGMEWSIAINNETVFQPLDADWYHVEDDIFDDDSWTKLTGE